MPIIPPSPVAATSVGTMSGSLWPVLKLNRLIRPNRSV